MGGCNPVTAGGGGTVSLPLDGSCKASGSIIPKSELRMPDCLE